MVYNGVVFVRSYTSIALLDKVYRVCKYIFDAHLDICNQVQGPVTRTPFIRCVLNNKQHLSESALRIEYLDRYSFPIFTKSKQCKNLDKS